MPAAPDPTGPPTVHAVLDELAEGIRSGDNVVLQAGEHRDAEAVLRGALRAAPGAAVYVSFRLPAEEVRSRFADAWDPQRFQLIDCHTPTGDSDDPAVQAVPPPTPQTVRTQLSELSTRLGEGTRYVFDGLTELQQRWSPDEALSLFLWACPKLYEERTVAYWTLERPAHTPAFLARLSQVTQVVIDLGREDDHSWMVLRKAAGRPDRVVDARVDFATDGETVLQLERQPSGQQRVGRLIKQQRTTAGLSQAELARRVGVSPSALSQTERGRHGMSGDVLMRVWEVLGVPLAELGSGAPTHRVFPRSSRHVETLLPGVTDETIVDSPDVAAHQLVFHPGASGTRSPFMTKRREFVVVLDGVLEVTIGRSEETLLQGDAILVVEPVRSWRNPAAEPARVLWVLLP